MAIAQLNNLDFYYEIEGNGIPLVLIAGLSCDSSHWDVIKEELASQFQIIRFDNRGVGRTTVPHETYTINDMAEDVIELLKYLNIDKAHILGHSMGGAVAQTIAYRKPQIINKLIISNSLVKMSTKSLVSMKHCADMYYNGASFKDTAPIIAPWVFSNEFLSQEGILNVLVDLDMNYPYPQSALGYSQQVEALATFDSRSWVQNINAPTLIIAGEEDILTPATCSQYMHDKIRNSKLIIQPGAHVPMMEIPDIYLYEVINFLNA